MKYSRKRFFGQRFWGTKQKFGLLKYESWNIGDDVQSLAARQYLPHQDCYVSRDHLDEAKDWGPFKMIMNGWWLGPFKGEPLAWPPPPNIEPLFISFHGGRDELFDPKYRDYYKQFEPIGCRGYKTLERFTDLGIDAYFSGCLTLTLKNPYGDRPRTDEIYFVDPFSFGEGRDYPSINSKRFRKDLWEKFPEEIRNKATYLRHVVNMKPRDYINPYKRARMASQMLRRYARAKLVITGRIHCALPCLAMGTPVIFLTESEVLQSDSRMGGLIDLFRHYSHAQILDGDFNINWDRPDANPVDISHLAEPLRQKCEEFIKDTP
ncbi:MAG: polysaccharide pyruvyl transferase family protein [Cyanobacteria bacterium P01_E01_bin.42]